MGVSSFMGEDENKNFFVQLMEAADQDLFRSFKSNRNDAGHANKRYIVYRHNSKTEAKVEPMIAVKVVNMSADMQSGVRITLENETNGDVMTVGHIPTRLFDTDVFIYAPPYQRLRYETWKDQLPNRPTHSLAFSIGICTASRSNNFKEGDTFCETPAELAKLYPNVNISIT